MEKRYKLVQDLTKGDLLSAYVDAPFDDGLEVLQGNDYRLISLEENARLRIQEGYEADISNRVGNWVLEDVIYVPNKGIFLTKVSHIMRNVDKAIKDDKEKYYIGLTDEQVEECFADCVELKIKDRLIPTNRFGENEITRYAFGEYAESYGTFLRDNEIKEMPIEFGSMFYESYASKGWFKELMPFEWIRKYNMPPDLFSLSGMSGLNCGNLGLRCDFIWVRGVRENK